MQHWTDELRADPLPPLLAGGEALAFAASADLLDKGGDVKSLWELNPVVRTLQRQRPDGSWAYPSTRSRTHTDYDCLATYEALLPLVYQYRLDSRHPQIVDAADYLLGSQTDEGDLRGIYGTQYSPSYTAAIVAALLDARCVDSRIVRSLDWLLAMRQDDGGWAIPWRTHPRSEVSSFAQAIALPEPLGLDRSKPSSHLITGVVLRALAASEDHRHLPQTRRAAEFLATRFFKADTYPDRRAAVYWEKLRFPFEWTDVASALDSMLRIGIDRRQSAVARALVWLSGRQGEDGLWRSAYGNAAEPQIHLWTSFAAARCFRLAAAR